MSAISPLHVTAALSWIAFLFRLPVLRRSPSASPARAYVGVLLFVAMALTFLLPEIYSAISGVTGEANLSLLLANGATAATCWAVQLYLLRVNFTDEALHRRIRWAHALFAAVLATLIVLFMLAPLELETRDFIGMYGGAPFVLEYRMVFLTYLGISAGALAHFTWRWSNRASAISLGTGVPLSLGLRVVALGGYAGLGYITNELGRMIVPRLGRDYPLPAPNAVSQGLVITAVTLMVLGSTLPALGSRMVWNVTRGWATRYRAYRRLFPLWLALYRAVPRIALVPTTSPLDELWAIGDLRYRLRRRVVEIRDGIVALSPYLDADVAALAARLARAAALPADETQIAVNAAVVAVAIHSCRARRRVARRTDLPLMAGGNDLAGEVDYLARLAHALRHSPVVKATLRQVGSREATQTASKDSNDNE